MQGTHQPLLGFFRLLFSNERPAFNNALKTMSVRNQTVGTKSLRNARSIYTYMLLTIPIMAFLRLRRLLFSTGNFDCPSEFYYNI